MIWAELAVAALMSAAPLAAQQTIVVDASGGGDFTNLPPAVAAAADGDTIVVRPGVYDGALVRGKGVIILGDPGSRVRSAPTSQGIHAAFRVEGLPSGSSFRVRGLDYLLTYVGAETCYLHAVDCQGTIAATNASISGPHRGFLIERCALVSLFRIGAFDCRAVVAFDSNVSVGSCVLQGQRAVVAFPQLLRPSSPALDARRSNVAISGSWLTGGAAASGGIWIFPSSPAVHKDAMSALHLGGSGLYAGGSNPCQNCPGSPALDGQGTIVHSPTLRLEPSGNQPPVGAGITLQRRDMSAARADNPLPPPGVFGTWVEATVGHTLELYLSLPSSPYASPLPGSGTIWIEFPPLIVLGRYVVPASGNVHVRFPLPALPELRGLAVTVQGLTATTTLASLYFGTPATFVLP